tara:strand:+ start:3497 stop:3973 length:477 start_codon:yes stop_codon:yes gene_type:complete
MNTRLEELCLICHGDGYIIETHDADSNHRECCPCSAGTMSHMVDSGHADKMDGAQLGDMLATIGCARVLEYTPDEAKAEVWQELRMCYTLQPFGFTADDLRDRLIDNCPTVLDAIHPNALGAQFRKASNRGLIRETGRRIKSRHASTHGRKQTVWERA